MLQVLDVSLAAVRALRPLVVVVQRHDRDLASQLRRAASSIVLNVAEGNRSQGANARVRFFTAAGSTSETRAALKLASAWGYFSDDQASDAEALLDRVAAMLCRLTHA